MIEIRKVQTIYGRRINHFIEAEQQHLIDAQELTLFPALIDPHVHFRVPGAEHKETWETGAAAAIAGGVTTVFDMPNNSPACVNQERLKIKKELIDAQLKNVQIPLRYHLFLGADSNHLNEIAPTKGQIIGLKIYMGSSTGTLLMNDRAALEKAFKIAHENQIIVAVHAENENLIQLNQKQYEGQLDPSLHSKVRNPAVAASAVELAIELAAKYGTKLYIVHVSSEKELEIIRSAKKSGLPVYAEAAPHHLFLNEEIYQMIGTQALVNPPLRHATDCAALWQAIHDGIIDTIGTDHAPHTLEEKNRPFGKAPSGFPSIELYFPLLLNAYHEKKISLEQIVSLTHTRPQEIFNLSCNEDVVLVDLNKIKKVEDSSLKTKAKWSPYSGRILQGWPRYTILNGKLFDLEKL